MNLFFSLTTDAAATGGGGLLFTVGYLALIFGFMWLVMIRPQKKKQKALDQMQSAISVGDSVLTNAGMYGKVVDIVNELLIVEFGMNKGVRIPIQRSSVNSVHEPNLMKNKETTEESK